MNQQYEMRIQRWQKVAPPYELFISPLEIALDPSALEQISFAYAASKYGHEGQIRDGGGRYFDHPKASAWIYIHEFGGRDPRAIIDLLLHDIQEDSHLLSSYRIARNFGEDIALDVRALTKLRKKKEPTKEYLERIIMRGGQSIVAKLCDRLHNLRTMSACSLEKQARQIKETQDFHLPLLIPALNGDSVYSGFAHFLPEKISEAIATHEIQLNT